MRVAVSLRLQSMCVLSLSSECNLYTCSLLKQITHTLLLWPSIFTIHTLGGYGYGKHTKAHPIPVYKIEVASNCTWNMAAPRTCPAYSALISIPGAICKQAVSHRVSGLQDMAPKNKSIYSFIHSCLYANRQTPLLSHLTWANCAEGRRTESINSCTELN